MHTVISGTTRAPYRSAWRRRPDVLEVLVGVVLMGGAVASVLLTVAVVFGAMWLIVVIGSDLFRRLGLLGGW
jgi:hypothetical protein